MKYAIGECRKCGGVGLSRKGNCPVCHGYGKVPIAIPKELEPMYEPWELSDRKTAVAEIERG